MTDRTEQFQKLMVGPNPSKPDKKRMYVVAGLIGAGIAFIFLYWQFILLLGLVGGIIYLRIKGRKTNESPSGNQ